MNIIHLLCICLCLVSTVGYGQVERKNSIQFSYGFMHSRLIDDGYSRNLLFRGTNSKFSLGYARETEKYRLHFTVEGSAGKVKSKSGNLPSKFYTAQTSLEYLVKIKPGSLFIGPRISSVNYFIINQYIFDNASIVSLHGLYFNVTKDLKNLRLSYSLPIAVYVNRLLWNGGASELSFDELDHPVRTLITNGSFRYFDLSNVQLRAEYIKNIGAKTDFVTSYQFRYFNQFYSNELLIGLKVHF